ncbi:MAG: DivIVA domain-containing protein, partial [Arachnia sp.]
MSLTLEEVRRVRFRMAKRNVTGYEVGDVDTFIDKVEESFAQFENERELLRREAESLRDSDDASPSVAIDEDHGAKDNEIAALRAEVDRLKSEAAAAPIADAS